MLQGKNMHLHAFDCPIIIIIIKLQVYMSQTFLQKLEKLQKTNLKTAVNYK